MAQGQRPVKEDSVNPPTENSNTTTNEVETLDSVRVVVGPRQSKGSNKLLTQSIESEDDIVNSPAYFYVKDTTSNKITSYHKIIIQNVGSGITEGVSSIPTNKGPIYLVGKQPPSTIRIDGVYLFGKAWDKKFGFTIISPKTFIQEYYTYLSAESTTKNNYDVFLTLYGEMIKVLVLGVFFGTSMSPILTVSFNLALLDESNVFKNLAKS